MAQVGAMFRRGRLGVELVGVGARLIGVGVQLTGMALPALKFDRGVGELGLAARAFRCLASSVAVSRAAAAGRGSPSALIAWPYASSLALIAAVVAISFAVTPSNSARKCAIASADLAMIIWFRLKKLGYPPLNGVSCEHYSTKYQHLQYIKPYLQAIHRIMFTNAIGVTDWDRFWGRCLAHKTNRNESKRIAEIHGGMCVRLDVICLENSSQCSSGDRGAAAGLRRGRPRRKYRDASC
jgi:hypothetical protein